MKKKLLIIYFLSIIYTVTAYTEDNTSGDRSGSSSFSQAKFVPDISFIMDFSGVYRNLEDEEFQGLELSGLTHAHEEDHEHSHSAMNGNRGFNLNYGELALYSAVDPYFELFTTFHLSTESFEIEEAFINTTSLPFGFQIKAGKFLSSFGRLNSQHCHYWDFSDQPLIYNAFLGDHGICEIGVQASWVAPVDTYVLLGAEVLQGTNESSFGTDGFHNIDTPEKEIEASNAPNLYTGFLKSSFDAGDLTLLWGVSGAFGKSRINHDLDEAAEEGNHGVETDTIIAGADLTLKYIIDSYRYISFQAEYLFRNMKGDWYGYPGGTPARMDIEKKQSGLYTQLVIRPFRLWRMGLRYELLHLNIVKFDGDDSGQPDNNYKLSAMVEYNPTEFSRIRLQYNYDAARYEGDDNRPVHEIILQINMTIGAHGAHKF